MTGTLLPGRAYREPADLARMRALLVEGTRSGIAASYAHPGILDFAMHYPPDEAERVRDLRVWEDDGAAPGSPAMLGFAIHLEDEGTFDLFVDPSVHGSATHEAILDEYLAWAEDRGREAGLAELSPWWATDDDTVQLAMLEARGFVRETPELPPPIVERSLDDLPPVRLPPGYRVSGVRTEADRDARARVTHAAFRPAESWPEYRERYTRFMASGVHEPERDLVVLDPEGRGAAACTIWLDEVNLVGLFEPVATHPDARRLGLGTAVMAEGLHRMRAAGMDRAILGFDPDNAPARALYDSLGFRTSATCAVIHRPLRGGATTADRG